MKKLDLQDLQLSPKVVTNLTGAMTSKGYTCECTGTETCNQSIADACNSNNDQCLSEVDNPCATEVDRCTIADCINETNTCKCGTDTCAGTQSGGEQCCYATIANASQCCITPPASNDVCLETVEDYCYKTNNCNETSPCPVTQQCFYTAECEPTEVNCYDPVETTLC